MFVCLGSRVPMKGRFGGDSLGGCCHIPEALWIALIHLAGKRP